MKRMSKEVSDLLEIRDLPLPQDGVGQCPSLVNLPAHFSGAVDTFIQSEWIILEFSVQLKP